MRITPFFLIAALCLTGTGNAAPLEQVLDGAHRQADKARDAYRHPAETLAFFQVEPEMTVVEIWPGAGGWYTAILAPWLRDHGTFYAAQFPADSGVDFYQRALRRYIEKLEAHPALYDQVNITHLGPPEHTDIAPAESADRVLTFRNVHNWAKAGTAEAAFESFFRALKPGGVLGVVEHRAPAGRPLAEQIESGYMTEAYVIKQAEKAGFMLEANASINANPADDTEHPAGVWTLPPTLRLGEQDRARYLDIGESDRMTLRFRKPE